LIISLIIARHLTFEFNDWRRLFEIPLIFESSTQQCQLCELCELALEKCPEILSFLNEKCFVETILSWIPSLDPPVRKASLKFASILLNVDKSMKITLFHLNCLPLIVPMVDSDSEIESADAIRFLIDFLPEFVDEIMTLIDCDLLWAILSDGIREGSFSLATASLGFLHDLIFLHKEFAEVVLQNQLCELGCRICQMSDLNLIHQFLGILGFVVNSAEQNRKLCRDFLNDWNDSELIHELEESLNETPSILIQIENLKLNPCLLIV
jgi:hypothetical protein